MTPAENGFRLPAEWEPHSATFFNWPNVSGDTFYDRVLLDPALLAFEKIIETVLRREKVILNVNTPKVEREVRSKICRDQNLPLEILQIPTREPWCRDVGPTFITSREGLPGAVSWKFNGWGEKCTPFNLDRVAGLKMAYHLNATLFKPDVFFEGGGLEGNGAGTVITTESCILNPNRNPDLSKTDAEKIFHDFLAAERTVWLPPTEIAGDDTDGHVDVVTRFINEDTVLTSVPKSPESVNFEHLDRNHHLLGKSGFNVIEIPLPEPIWDDYQKLWIPPSYANFYIGNGYVLAPVFDIPEDEQAISILENCFPEHEIIPIPSMPIIAGLGGIHCLAQQVPAIFSKKTNRNE